MHNVGAVESADAIAIIGMTGRFPGAKNIEELWQNLRHGRESIRFFPDHELEDTQTGTMTRHHPQHVKAGAILDDIELFDAAFFGFTPREADIMDPQHRLFLECAWEAMEMAGYNTETYQGAIGVYAGTSVSTYFLTHIYPRRDLLTTMGGYNIGLANRLDFLSTRVSYKLNLKGPGLTIQTACSTSLAAVHLACQSLLNGECEMALAGGVSISVPQKTGYIYQQGGILSPDGHCRAFDARAQGTVGGNGVGVVVLKRLAEALQDGDSILAVIKGSAMNNDGAVKAGFTAPSVDGQAAVIAEALAIAGVDPGTVTYVEAHGTGTILGDPIEINALTQAFRLQTPQEGFCALGSVKTNIGHLDAAAGVAGLIKTALALHHKMLPPSLHFEQPNPQIDFARSPFYVNTGLTAWQTDRLPRRAGVSSLGIGGTNVHLVLEEAPSLPASGPSRPCSLLVLSAQTGSALDAATTQLAAYLQQHAEMPLADVAYTLQVGRRAFRHRRMVVCRTTAEAVTALERREPQRLVSSTAETRDRPVVFMFPGQGAQYVNMGLELYRQEAVFRAHVEHCATLLLPHLGCDLCQVLYPCASQAATAARQLLQTSITQPALFVVEYALAQLWMAWGIRPQALIGHSIGEYVAACLAGVFTLEDALALVAARGRLMQQLPAGAMLAVALSEPEVQALVSPQISLAASNGPALHVVSGPTEALGALEQRLRQQGVAVRRLQTSHAFHSAMMEPILEPFTALVTQATLKPPRIPYISNVTGTWMTAAAPDGHYWARHVRQPVRFAAGLGVLLQDPQRLLLEVGPGQTLSTCARRHPDKAPEQVVLASLRPDQEAEVAGMLHTLGRLWLAGAAVDWSGLSAGERRRRLPLPTYPFERKRHWVAPAVGESDPAATATRESPTLPHHAAHEQPRHPLTRQQHESPRTTSAERDTRMSAPPVAVASTDTRQEHILSLLKTIAHEVSGIDPADIDVSTTFLAMGVNSLLLIQFSQAIQEKFVVEMPFRLLFEDLSSLDALTAYLDRVLPPDAFRVEPPIPESGDAISQQQATLQPAIVASPHAPGTETWNGAEPHPLPSTALERIIAQQLQVMAQQLTVLRGSHPVAEPWPAASPPAPVDALQHARQTQVAAALPHVQARRPTEAPSGAAPAASGTRHAERLGPYRPLTRGARDGLSRRQQEHLNALMARYTGRIRESKRLTQAYRPFLADTRAIVGFRLPWKEMVCPIVAARALGSKVWDVDGNEYIDLTMGFGVNLFGHAPAFITAALEEQLREGMHIGPQSPLVGKVAQLVSELTGLERVTFCNTGSEAVMAALRLARTATRRSKFAVFAGSYHGNFEEVLFRAQAGDGQLRAVPIAPGIPPHLLQDVLVVEYNRPESLDILRAHAHELAAVLVEPVQSNRLDVQPRAFLHALRQLTTEAGTALIFDEMITGFRLHPGGAQAWFGVQADLATYGKVIGGGMPLGVVAGKAAYMDAIDGGMWNYGDASYPRATLTFFAGTFCKHPLAMAAAWATLNALKSHGPALQQQLNRRTEHIVETLQSHFMHEHLPIRLDHCGSMFRFVFERGVPCPELFYFHLLDRGIHLWDGRACFLSTAHTDTDVAEVIRIVQESVAALRDGGFFPASSTAVAVSGAAQETESPPGAMGTAPLTEGQKDIWLMTQLGDDASRASNLATTLRMRGQFNTIAMQQALQALVQRHQALRTTFSPDGASQLIHPTMTFPCPLVDLSAVDHAACEAHVTQGITRQIQQVFDLVNGPLLRVHIARLAEHDHLLVFVLHHIIIDGRSFGLLMQEFKALYAAACQGIAPQLSQPRPFREYAMQQARQRHAPETIAAEAYWLGQFHDRVPFLELPTDRPRPLVQTYAGARQEMQIAETLHQALKDLSAGHGCTLFMTLLAGFQVLLHRLTGQDDIVVGIAAVEPAAASGKNLLGYATNLLPLRSRVRASLTFPDYLTMVKQVVFDAYTHQSYAVLRLIDKLQLLHEPGMPPLISAVFNMDYSGTEPEFFALEVEMASPPSGAVECETFWNVTETANGLFVACDYNTDLFDVATIRRWLEQYQALLMHVVNDQWSVQTSFSLTTNH